MFQNLVSYKIWYLDSAKIVEMKMSIKFNVINTFFQFAEHVKLTVHAEIRHGDCKEIEKSVVFKE